MSDRKKDVEELQGAGNAIRAYLQTHRHIVQVGEKIEAALAANARLTQWEKEEEAIRARVAEARQALIDTEQKVQDSRDALRLIHADIDAANERLHAADAEVQGKIKSLEIGLEREREKHETAKQSMADEIATATRVLAALKADAQKIREHFAGAPA